MNQEINLLPSIVTASAALIGAVVAQIISHIFTLRHDNKKYQMEIYQNLYSTIIFNIYTYIDSSTFFYGGIKKDNIDEEKYKNNTIEHVSKNLKYCSPILIEKYNSVNTYNYLDDPTGYRKSIDELSLFVNILEEYFKITKKNKILNESSINSISKYEINYYFWICSYEYTHSQENAKIITSYKWLFDENKYSVGFLKALKKLTKSNKWEDALLYFGVLAIDQKSEEEFQRIVDDMKVKDNH